MKRKVEARMQKILGRLGIPLKIRWTPRPDHNKHGLIELNSRTLFVFDAREEDAWQTFIHEILEWRFRRVYQGYRTVINSLIEVVENLVYRNKEEFLEFLPQIFKLVEEEKKIEQKS